MSLKYFDFSWGLLQSRAGCIAEGVTAALHYRGSKSEEKGQGGGGG